MEIADASTLIRTAVTPRGGVWADLGAGSGTFTLALASLLGEGGVVYAVDRDARAMLTDVAASPNRGAASIERRVADFREPLPFRDLDGIVMANSLHFISVEEQASVLASVARHVRPGGAVVLVEYDQRRGSPWVPFPVPFEAFAVLAREAGLGAVREIGRRRSRYGAKEIYAAAALTAPD